MAVGVPFAEEIRTSLFRECIPEMKMFCSARLTIRRERGPYCLRTVRRQPERARDITYTLENY